MLGLYISVPVASFRPGTARVFRETNKLPSPAMCYGFLLSLVGETNRHRYIGSRIMPILLNDPATNTMLRFMWRMKHADLTNRSNYIPGRQELLSNVEVAIWLDGAELEERVQHACANPASIDRFGGLCLGESTHLVDEVLPWERVSRRFQDRVGKAYVHADIGWDHLPVWVDHVGSARTTYAVGNIVDWPLHQPPQCNQMTTIVRY